MKRPHRKSTTFNLFLGFLWLLLARLAFHFLPMFPAILVSVAAFALMLRSMPTKQEQQEEIRQKIEESKENWRGMNK